MHSSVASISMVLPLQVICIFMILVGAHSSGQVAKPGCRDRCGNLSIPYPFGIGSDCSLDPSFYISCNTSTDPPEAYLSAIDKHLQVLEINQTYVRVKYPILVSVCYDLSAYEPAGTDSSNLTAPQSYKHSMNVDLSGTPYSLSVANSITAIGCDDMVFGIDQLKDSYLTGGCSAICTDSGNTDGHGVGFCPVNDTLIGNGCCRAPIFGALTVKDKYSLGAELVDLSSKLARRKLFPCSYAFIQEEIPNATVFSYPLHYLHNATAFLDDNWASASRPPVVRLDWSFGSENCSRAQLNFTTYACRDNKSVCVDEVDDYLITTGYICRCVQGYEGNPYLPGGCKPISFSSSVAKPGCQDQCGKLSIPFPFGMGPNCFLAPSFEVICNTSTNPPIAYLSILNTEIIELNSSKVSVKYPNQPGYVCYNYSDYSRVSKTEERSLMIDLSTTQYTLSGENSITTVGCDDMLVGVIGQGNRSFMGSACASVCSDRRDSIIRGELIQDAAFCPSVESPGDGCCRAPIPPGTSYLEANLMDISGEWPVVFSCSYAFFQLNRNPESNLSPQIQRLSIYNSTEVLMETEGEIELALDWRVGNLNCKQAQLVNSTSFACQANTDCIDFDATTTVGGYLCNCSRGFQGNPYLASGCQDIDECADNPCVPNAICSNTIGSFYCSCKKGYFGDGTKDGKGCIQRPETKTIILIGMGSGLGFLLILVMLFWLYKLLQKRRAIMLREKFFKRNGGLLLRQQTNEGALGKTKVFPSKELEIATDNFNESRILGQGGQGTVYKGMLSDGKIVAVKKSKLVEENQLEQFINEVVILSQINHRNVVQLLGCCLETEVPLLVYEFMPNGTLYELIHDPNNEFAIPWNMRLKIAADIAGALAYLHSASSMPIYHRDIKSSNILLDEKYVVKVSDFGTSRSVDVDQTHLTTLVKGTFGYLDPEYFQSSQFTEKSDVYSFGVVLVELLTGQKPISFDKTEEERGLATRFLTCMEHNCLDTILDPQVSEQGRKEEVTIVARLAQRCLHLKGKMRPTMKEVANELESLRISQMSTIANNETEDVSGFEGIPMTISDGAYTWTGSYNSVAGSLSSDTHPLTFATM